MALLYLQTDTGNPRHRGASENSIASAPQHKASLDTRRLPSGLGLRYPCWGWSWRVLHSIHKCYCELAIIPAFM